jgi:hypothetical protein
MTFAAAMAFADDSCSIGMHGHPHPGDIDRQKSPKKNLETIRIAELARTRNKEIRYENVPEDDPVYAFQVFASSTEIDTSAREARIRAREAAIRAAEDQARKELGDKYSLVEIGDVATIDQLTKDLDVQDRLDAMIDKCLKRLLFVRGLKSISTAPPPAAQQRLTGPTKAA